MRPVIFWRSLCLVAIAVAFLQTSAHSQTWNPNHTIGTLGGGYNIVYNQTPPAILEIYPAAYPSTGLVYQWEASNLPTTGFWTITGATQSGYSLAGPLQQTTYVRRKTINPGNSTFVYSNTIKLNVVSANWEDVNYVRQHDVTVSGVSTWLQVDGLPIGQKLQTTTYLDGLGRSVQKISRETATPSSANGLWGDVVQFSKYDAYGNEEESRLPYTTTTQSGKYKSDPKTEQEQYYSSVYNEIYPYTALTFEESPLDRVFNVKEPGNAWHTGLGKSVGYETNTTNDAVRDFEVTYVQGDLPVDKGFYPPNVLFKSVYTDENGKKVIDFVNKSGQTILKKVELEDNHPNAYAGWICTYFVYDDFGQLRFQLQPEAVNYLANNNWSFAGTSGQQVFKEWCFQYYYDQKGRTVWKKSPGAEPLQMIYDIRDRLVFTQDGNQRAKAQPEWTATIYDVLDRPLLSTLYLTAKTIAQLQADVDNGTTTPVSVGNAPAPVIDLLLSSRDQSISRYAAQNSIEFNAGFESPSGDEFLAEIDPTATAGSGVALVPYLNPISAADLNNATVCTVLTYQFYDNYAFTRAKSFNSNFTNTTAYNTGDPNVQPVSPSKRTLSFPTGSLVRVLGTANFLASTSYYDTRGSLIQTLSDNILSGSDITTLQYHFDGRVLSSCSDHTTAGTGYSNFKTLTKYLFDKLGRVTSVQKSFDASSLKTIASYDYDDVGRVKTKHLDPGYTGNGGTELESLNYSFNIHNQLTGINKDYALKTPGLYSKWEHFFGLYLGYDNRDGVFAKPELNGQVSGALWTTQGDDAQRKYDYQYDHAGRLTSAVFKEQLHPGDGWMNNKMDFSVSGANGKIKYDLNGNLLEMLQKGVVPGQTAPVTIDDLRYQYYDYGNRLKNVSDAMTATSVNGVFGDFKDGTNSNLPDYVYDKNGNLVIDLNKNVRDLANQPQENGVQYGIRYNYLDKPDQIRISGKGTINIVYSAGGEKLQRTFTPETGTPTTTTYVNQFVYQSTGVGPAALSYINFEEGRIRVMSQTAQNNGYDLLTVDGNLNLPNGKRGVFDYFILDYQQNVRMILSEETHVASNTASMETGRASVEEAVFGQVGGANEVAATRYAAGNTGWQNSNIQSSVSKLEGYSGHSMGPNTLQKVMAGDYVTANVQYYYNTPASGSGSILSSVLGSLLQAMGGGTTAGAIHQGATNVTTQLNNNLAFQTAVQPPGNNGSQTPQAYLTVLFFDERFNLVDAQNGGVYQQQVAASVTSNGSSLQIVGVKAPKNGYVYAYVSNAANVPVYFDNFAFSIAQGNILEENHYYAFGLKIQGLSSKRTPDSYQGTTENKFGMQGAFSEMDDDIAWNDFALRNYDPQIGRFVQIDPYADSYLLSPYAGMGNNPVNTIDPSGGFSLSAITGTSNGVINAAVTTIGGMMIGGIVDWATGGDGKGALYGAMVGLGVGSGSLLTLTQATLQATNLVATQLTGGISTVVYNQYGNLSSVLPDAVQKTFNQEYGIKVNYADGRLTYGGDIDPGQKISEIARRSMLDVLQKGANGILVFGYNLKVIVSPVLAEIVDAGLNYPRERFISIIDLADFNSDLSYKGIKLTDFPRFDNIARVIEHEFLGHGVRKKVDPEDLSLMAMVPGGPEHDVVNPIRRQLGLPERMTYSSNYNKKSGIYISKYGTYTYHSPTGQSIDEERYGEDIFLEIKIQDKVSNFIILKDILNK